MIKILRNKPTQHKKDFNSFDHILLTHPKVVEDSNYSKINSCRLIMKGTIDKIGADILRIKELGIGIIIFGFGLSSVFKGVHSMIDMIENFQNLPGKIISSLHLYVQQQ